MISRIRHERYQVALVRRARHTPSVPVSIYLLQRNRSLPEKDLDVLGADQCGMFDPGRLCHAEQVPSQGPDIICHPHGLQRWIEAAG
jgi:hypothetical protein